MKKITLLILFTFITKCFTAQNLIPNPSFENYTSCPNFGGEINYCTNWNNVNLVYGVFTVGTPDYFNACGTANCAPPNTFAGQCNPHTGNAMIALVMYDSPAVDYREYASTQLTCPMVTGSTYTVSFWLTNGLNPISPYTIKNIGACFSTTPLTQSGWNLINVTPQVELTTLVGSTSWVQYSFTVTPTANWQYLTLGSFRADVQNTPTLTYSIVPGNASVYANYFFDDIEVIGTSGSNISISGSSTICAGQNITLTASGASSYTWSTGATTDSIILNPTVTTTYTVTGKTGSCPSQTALATVNVSPPTSTVSISGTNTVCSGESITLTASGANTYTWNTGSTTSGISIISTVTSTYTVVGAIGTCTTQAVATVTVIPGPLISVGGSTVICAGESTTLMANGANTYVWSTGATAANVAFNPGNTTTYTVVGTNGTCTAQAVATVSVNPIPVVSITGNTVACSGTTTSLMASGADTYVWSNGANTATINFNPTTTATYTVVGAIGACTNQQIITVNVVSGLTILISGDTTFCSGYKDTLTASGAITYIWSTGANTAAIIITPTVTTTYSVTGSVGTCVGSAVETVHVQATPVAIYTLSPNPASTLNPVVQFLNESVNYTHLSWNFGDGSALDSIGVNPSHYYNTENGGSYQTSLTLSNQDGCTDVTTVILVIDPIFTFYIPNTFTPNGDGINDVFKGEGMGIAIYEIWIFDRWGACIFSANSINKGWDGTLNSKSGMVQEDVYVWKVNITDMLQATHNYHGTVSIVK